MTLSLNIPQHLEARLREEAARAGLQPADYVPRLIERHLPRDAGAKGLLELLEKWEADDATDDPAELARREREAEAFMTAMNQSRRDSEGPNARIPYPDVD